MRHSESIADIAKALTAFQKALVPPKKTETNPFYRSKYADLAEVWDACREPLTDNGLSFIQTLSNENEHENFTATVPVKDREGRTTGSKEVLMIWLTVTSRLQHVSEQFFEDVLTMPVEADPQSLGKVTTYIRRYAQMAMLGVAPEDDDGESAREKGQGPVVTKPPARKRETPPLSPEKPPAPTQDKLSDYLEVLKRLEIKNPPAMVVKLVQKHHPGGRAWEDLTEEEQDGLIALAEAELKKRLDEQAATE